LVTQYLSICMDNTFSGSRSLRSW